MTRTTRTVAPASQQGPSITENLRGSSNISIWRRIFSALLQRQTWIQAVRVQRVVIRNVIGSIACAWAANAVSYLGNPFSLKSSPDQSTEEIIVANVVWCGLLYALMVVLIHVPAMATKSFFALMGQRPSAFYCVKRILRYSGVCICATLLLIFGMGVLTARLSRNKSVAKFKPEYYGIVLCNHILSASIMLASRRIYFQETEEGRDRLTKRTQKNKPHRVISTVMPSTRIAPSSVDIKYVPPSFCRAYTSLSHLCGPVVLTGCYVQLLSQLRISNQNSWVLVCFMVSSMLLKLVLQEAAKHFLMKKLIQSVRTMSLVVGIPTVMIDTQTRIILLGGVQNTGMTAAWTLGMAILEVSFRLGKAVRISRQHPSSLVSINQSIHNGEAQNSDTQNVGSVSTPTPSIISKQMSFVFWRQQRQVYHTAEVNADMYAEYISIGCSASILFFYGNHPHYSYLKLMSTADVGQLKTNQSETLLLQLAVEMIVDYVSIVLEISAGVDFSQTRGVGAYLAAIFGTIAIDNIFISAIMYLD